MVAIISSSSAVTYKSLFIPVYCIRLHGGPHKTYICTFYIYTHVYIRTHNYIDAYSMRTGLADGT